VRRWTIEERRARVVARHHLAAPAGSAVEATRALVVLHATDPTTVYLSLAARLHRAVVEEIEADLYEQRSLVRMLGMRRTMFVVPTEDVPIVQGAAADALAPIERRRTIQLLEQGGVTDHGEAWLVRVERATMAALEARGEATAAELGRDVPDLQTKISVNEGKAYAGSIGMSSRVLLNLATEGRIVRGRPLGTWISSQYRWAPVDRWLGDRQGAPMAAEAARAELARRWLARFGPATVADLRWWAGWTAGHTKRALEAVQPAEVDLHGEPGIALAGDDVPEPKRRKGKPAIALLPALDPTTMGWAGRDWYLGEHRAALFDRNGNAGPTIWCDGRIVGGWAQRASGEIAWRLLEGGGAAVAAAVERAAHALEVWLGGTRSAPRFPTPLQKELSA
jgi:hypothetical protein